MTLLGNIGRSLKTRLAQAVPVRDFDEEAVKLWWGGGDPSDIARLRTAHPAVNDQVFNTTLGRARHLHGLVLDFPFNRKQDWRCKEDLTLALERRSPGLSARAYSCAADRIVQCFMTFESWM